MLLYLVLIIVFTNKISQIYSDHLLCFSNINDVIVTVLTLNI
jgi:hypothetical protein